MAARFAHALPWGTEIVDGGARFRLWAPAQNMVALHAEGGSTVPLAKMEDGSLKVGVVEGRNAKIDEARITDFGVKIDAEKLKAFVGVEKEKAPAKKKTKKESEEK